MTKLKPCPFCGSKDVACMEQALGNYLNVFQYVACKTCGCRTLFSRSESIVVKAWNRRAGERE